jgi:activator of HSP90 ATPase
MISKNLRQSVTFQASPHDIYEILMDPGKHSILTGSNVKVERKVGSRFSVYDGDIQGENLELIPDRKIIQSWRYADWPRNHYSKVTFSLKAASNGTLLSFRQTGIPEKYYEEIKQGWKDYYWNPMKKMLKKQK